MTRIDFYRARRMIVNFDDIELSDVDFTSANLRKSHLWIFGWHRVNFTDANLCEADLSVSTFTYTQFAVARSLRDAKLRNSRIGSDPNLIKNPPGLCNSTIFNSWTTDSIPDIFHTQNFGGRCLFVAYPDGNQSILSQTIQIQNILDFNLWPTSHALIVANVSKHVLVTLSVLMENGTIQNEIHIG